MKRFGVLRVSTVVTHLSQKLLQCSGGCRICGVKEYLGHHFQFKNYTAQRSTMFSDLRKAKRPYLTTRNFFSRGARSVSRRPFGHILTFLHLTSFRDCLWYHTLVCSLNKRTSLFGFMRESLSTYGVIHLLSGTARSYLYGCLIVTVLHFTEPARLWLCAWTWVCLRMSRCEFVIVLFYYLKIFFIN